MEKGSNRRVYDDGSIFCSSIRYRLPSRDIVSFQASIGGMQPVPMGGMIPQQNQQMGFGAPMVAVNPGLGAPGAPPMISPTSAAKENLQKKADQAFADLAVFK